MSGDELVIAPLCAADLPELSAFMAAQGQTHTGVDRLRHWYLGNPSGSASVVLGLSGGRVVGMATTNDHPFTGPAGDSLVAMPQKVLTDVNLRGKGIFAKLYWAAEGACRERGVGFFLTVTNAASTPMFLGRFGYQRLPAPAMLVWPPAVGAVPSHDPTAIVPPLRQGTTEAWHMCKDEVHYRWRFTELPEAGHIHLAIDGLGHLFLRRFERKGVPVLMLLDAVPQQAGALREVIRIARRVALRQGCIALIALAEDRLRAAGRGWPVVSASSGFNLLVKGLDDAHTQELIGQRYALAFGDLDFL